MSGSRRSATLDTPPRAPHSSRGRHHHSPTSSWLARRLTGRFSRGATSGLVALAGLALLVLGPTGVALGWYERTQQDSGDAPQHLPGMEVRDGPATFVLHEVRCGMDEDRAANGRRCLATIGARNDGSDPLTIAGSGQALHSPEGVRHFPVNGSSAPFGTLQPGEGATAVLEFDVPTHVEITHVGVRAEPYSPGGTVSLPGPPLPLN